jgi:hypothetical protein
VPISRSPVHAARPHARTASAAELLDELERNPAMRIVNRELAAMYLTAKAR